MRLMAEENKYRSKRPTTYNVKSDCTVDEFFDRQMNGMSKTGRRKMLSHGVVRIGERVLRKPEELILAGSTVSIWPRPTPTFNMPNGLQIVYEDDYLIVANKEAGLLTIATETEREHTAYAYLSAYLKFYRKQDKIFIVHRLDRMTSGLLVFAKSEMVQRALRENWNDTVVSRRYVAVVEGRLRQSEGTINTWIDEDPQTLRMYVSRPGYGKRAITHYKLIDQNANMSLVELNLETGRKNQIRVHMRHLGHTLAGDKKYGSQIDPIGRLCLHAMQIEFYHPMTGKLLNFETKIPQEFSNLFKR